MATPAKSKTNPKARKALKTAVKSTSPFADYYKMWNALATRDASSPSSLHDVIKQLVELSTDEYFYSPVPLPASAQSALSDMLRAKPDTKDKVQFDWRRKIIRQFKRYLDNQATHADIIQDAAALKWGEALALLKSEVAFQGTGEMCLTAYPVDAVAAIFKAANEASRALWIKHQLLFSRLPTRASDPSREEYKKYKRARKHNWTATQLKAYEASAKCKPIKVGKYAASLGVTCDQESERFTIRGLSHKLTIRASSTTAWMIIRLLVESPEDNGQALLPQGWYGALSGTDRNKTTLRSCIKAITKNKVINAGRFHLVAYKTTKD